MTRQQTNLSRANVRRLHSNRNPYRYVGMVLFVVHSARCESPTEANLHTSNSLSTAPRPQKPVINTPFFYGLKRHRSYSIKKKTPTSQHPSLVACRFIRQQVLCLWHNDAKFGVAGSHDLSRDSPA